MNEPLTKDKIKKMEPLTHEKIYCVEEDYIAPTGFRCNFSHCKKAFLMDDVLSAVMLLREKIRELPNRDNELRFLLPKATKTISLGKLDGGGIGRFKVMKIIDEVFGGVEK